MSLLICDLKNVPEELWLQARATPLSGVFYHRPLLSLWEKIYSWRGCVYVGDNCALFGFEKQTAIGKSFYSLPFGWYGGFVGEQASETFVGEVIADLRRRSYLQYDLIEPRTDLVAQYERSFRRRDLTTHVVDLTAPASYDENTRRNIRSARSHGMEIRKALADDFSAIVQLLQLHQRRTGEKRRVKAVFYDSLAAISLASESGVECWLAICAGEILAAHIYFSSDDDIFYFDGFMNHDGAKMRANFLLFATTIERARANEQRRLNLGATPAGDSGLERFKLGWGAEPLVVHEFTHRSGTKRLIDRVRGR